jgi:hypothetical protein
VLHMGDTDEIEEAAQILRDARDQGHTIYVNACINYIVKMNPCEVDSHA